MTGIIIAAVIVVPLLIIGIYIGATYNGLVKLKNSVEEAFSTMDVYLKKRWDLIPNIVESVKGYWLCSYKAAGRTECAGDRVREDAVMSAFIRMSDKLAQNREELLGDLIRQLEKLQSRTSTSGEQVI